MCSKLGADGTSLLPTFIDGDGVSLDADGMPENAMFYLDIRNGKAYFRGDIYADNGVFKGIVKATDFQTKDGTSMLTKDGKFDSKYLDLGGIVIDGETGNINFSGVGSITWGDYAPNGIESTVIMYAVGTSGTTPPVSGWQTSVPTASQGSYLWTKTTITYTDGTTSDSYAVGYHGQNGQTPMLPTYIKETYIDKAEIRSPTIKANDYFIYPADEEDHTGSFVIRGGISGSQVQRDMFRIDYNGDTTPPTTYMSAHSGTTLEIGTNTGKVKMTGNLDLSSANITDWGDNAPTAVFG